MNRKLALITIHWANSYGGMLQAFATQKILGKYGTVSIIDYKTTHLSKSMRLFRYGCMPRDFLRMGKDLFRINSRYQLLKKFKLFINENFNLTNTCSNINHLKSLEKSFDVFICGSDQIWNPNIIDGFDGAYFLNFIKEKKKISYASSCGSYKFSDIEEKTLVSYLEDFTNISVREENTADYLSTILQDKEINTVIDPTLMFTKQEWLNLLNITDITTKDPYVLIYTLRKDDFLREVINIVSSTLDLKIVVIDQDISLGYKHDKHIKDADPKEYVKLIAGASFVITNSFHGTVFSTNFEIPFVSIRPESGLNRMKYFLKNVGLEKRLILNKSDLNLNLDTKIDFKYSSNQLKILRKIANDYLDKSFLQ